MLDGGCLRRVPNFFVRPLLPSLEHRHLKTTVATHKRGTKGAGRSTRARRSSRKRDERRVLLIRRKVGEEHTMIFQSITMLMSIRYQEEASLFASGYIMSSISASTSIGDAASPAADSLSYNASEASLATGFFFVEDVARGDSARTEAAGDSL